MRVAVLDAQGHIINLIAVESESDIAGFDFHGYRILAEGESVDIWEDPNVLVSRANDEVETFVQNAAKAKGYTNGLDSCARYVAFPNEWQAESLALLEWNVAVWKAFFTWSDVVLDGGTSELSLPTAP